MLYIVPTRNLEDITFRAVRILKEVDFILAENIFNSKKLLNYYNIKNKPKGEFVIILQGNEARSGFEPL